MIVTACGAASAPAPSNVSPATKPVALRACYANVASPTEVMRRTYDPAHNTITVDWFDRGDVSKPRDVYVVDGHGFSGIGERGTLEGPAWQWTSWRSTYQAKTLTIVFTGMLTATGVASRAELRTTAGYSEIKDSTWRTVDCSDLRDPKPQQRIDI